MDWRLAAMDGVAGRRLIETLWRVRFRVLRETNFAKRVRGGRAKSRPRPSLKCPRREETHGSIRRAVVLITRRTQGILAGQDPEAAVPSGRPSAYAAGVTGGKETASG